MIVLESRCLKNFADRLHEAIQKKDSRLCVGIDPRLDRLPPQYQRGIRRDVERAAESVMRFSGDVINAVADHAVAVKLQIAFYELLGPWGLPAYFAAAKHATKQGLIVIGDVKRGDIAETARAYADAHLSSFSADAITVNPYFGSDGIEPFVQSAKKYGGGLFILVKTSNPSSAEFQDLKVDGRPLYRLIADRVTTWGESSKGTHGYSAVGAVVGATHPDVAKELRAAMPNCFFLVPGYGAQGATAADVAHCFKEDGSGAIVNASRSIIYAFSERSDNWAAEVTAAAEKAKIEINEAIRK